MDERNFAFQRRQHRIVVPSGGDNSHRVLVKNTEYEVVPPYACMRIIGTETVGGKTALTVEKATSTDGQFVFNSPHEIAVDGTGWAYRWGIVVMLGDGTPPTAANVSYSPVVDSWEITEGDGPFVVFGEDMDAPNALVGRFAGGGGIKLYHGIVVEQCSNVCSTYKVQLVHRYVTAECKDCY